MNQTHEQIENQMDLLSFGQESLWFLDQFESASALYLIPIALRLRGELNVEALRKAFETILQRHEVLRTNFVSIGGRPMQCVSPNQPFELPQTDLSRLSHSEREAAALLRLDEEFHRPFNLSADLMLRAGLLRLGEREQILFISMHHIAADAWSIALLHNELSVLYRSICAGEPCPLPEPEVQYADFAVYQRKLFQGKFAADQIAYWKERLAGELPVLNLPSDRPAPTRQTFRGALRFFKISSELRDALKQTCRSEKVTVFTFTLAVFYVLLQRYSRQDDILVGCPVATRNLRKLEPLIGYFINTVVVRGNVSGNPSFADFLLDLNQHVIGALSHQDVPLERLVEELKVPRQPGRNPLVQACFQYFADPLSVPTFPGVAAELIPIDTRTSKFDLSLVLNESPDGLLGEVEYSTDLFEAASIERVIGHYQTLLEGAVAHPARRISELPLLTKSEENQILIEWNNTAAPFPQGISVVELLENQAAANRDRIAVIFGEGQLTWGELNERANRLAHRLKKIGVQREQLVGICMERSIEMVVAVHGVLKSGAAFFPLDPEYPPERLRYMLEDAQAPVLICQKRFAAMEIPKGTKVLCIDADWEQLIVEPSKNLATKPAPGDLAYVIYTSGSTGKPKGVMIAHDAICNHLFWMQKEFPLTPDDRILQKTSFSFDVAIWELLGPIASGATLVMAKPGGHRDSAYIAEIIREKQITLLQIVPSALRALLDEPAFAETPSLKYVLCGGEEMSADLPARFEKISRATLVNSYGPTEAAIDSACWICPRPNQRTVHPIGRPIANAEIYLLDPNLQPVPVGVPGELCVGGRGLARGYWRRPELTAEKFIPHPFAKTPGERLYKTGDLARYLPNGEIEFLGRIDHQVKVRGFRIELGEIETLLRNCPEVREAIVVARASASGENRLVAYWVPAQGFATTDTPLRKVLEAQLPDFMVPAAFVALESLPSLPNGKVNRNALPAPEFVSRTAQFIPPRTEIEKQLAKIWTELLQVERIGVNDNFFDLGGHSLLATQVVSRMRSLNRGELTLRELFNAPTIAALSACLEESASQSARSSAFQIKALPRNAATAALGST